MSLSALLNRPCVITRRVDSGTDDYGDPSTASTTEDTVCELQLYAKLRSTGGETELDQAAIETGHIFLPGTLAPPGALDAVTITDLAATYEFDGPAEPVRNPRTGLVSHLQASVRRVR